MLQVENLSKSYAGELLFSDVSFCVGKGEKCAFVGRNGSGKTTILKIFKGEETADAGQARYSKGYRPGFLEQHIEFTQPTALEEALCGPVRKQPHEIESILFGLGFDHAMLDAHPSSLSGGYHLRLKLAKLLAEEPNCLLLDEPTNYLDIAGLRFLENYLKKWKGELVCVSHDRAFLDAVSTHTMGLHRKGFRKYAGGTENFYEKIVEEEELREKTRINLDKKRKHAIDYIERFGAKASKASQAKSKEKALEKLPALSKLASLEDLYFSFPYSLFSGKKMLALEDVCFSYSPPSSLIEHVSLEIEKGKKIAIIGKNGTGKSTLLKLIAQELSPQKGTVWISDQTRIGYFGQTNISRLHGDHTIEEEIASADSALPYSKVRAICGQMMFSQDAAKKKISVLSGGERARVLLGKILATPTNFLLLDEPTHHLDIESIDALLHAMTVFEGSLVLVTHSEELLQKIPTDYLIIAEQKEHRIFRGTYTEFLEKGGWQESVEKQTRTESVPKKASSNSRKPSSYKIAELEKKIEADEEKLEEITSLIALSYQKGNPEESKKLLQESERLTSEIETSYAKLTELYT